MANAIGMRSFENLELLVRAGAELHYRSPYGSGALLAAADLAWWEAVYFLIENGADPWFGYEKALYERNILDSIDSRRGTDEAEKKYWKEKICALMLEKGHDVGGH